MQETARNLSDGREQEPWEAPTSSRDEIAQAQDIGGRHARIADRNTEQEAPTGVRENQQVPNIAGRPPEAEKNKNGGKHVIAKKNQQVPTYQKDPDIGHGEQ